MRLLSKLKTIVKTSTPSTTTLTSILKESEAIETAPIFTLADRLPQLPALPNIPRRASARVRQLLPSVPFVSNKPQLDILIIGAGISGIDMATHISRDKRLSKSLKKDGWPSSKKETLSAVLGIYSNILAYAQIQT